jgi:hypothetical protein
MSAWEKCLGFIELLKNIRTNPYILLNISSEIRTFLPGRHFIYAYAYIKCLPGRNVRISLSCQLCLLGDRYQSIYDFNKADERYLTFADVLFQINNLEWSRVNLSNSFRLNQQMTNFINRCVKNVRYCKDVK